MGLLSVSIDLCGSTLAKQSLVTLSTNDERHRKRLYATYLSLLYGMEREFYLRLMDNQFFDFSKLFLVKTIGDELWYMYQVDETDENELARSSWAIFEALMGLFSCERRLDLASPDGKGDALLEVKFNLPIKAFIDLVAEPIEMNLERYEYLKDIVSTLKGDNSVIYHIDQHYTDICNRLNLGSTDLFGKRVRVLARTDYIGLEIDRFFRATKFCNPLLLAVGASLMNKLPYRIERAAENLDHIGVKKLVLNVPGEDGKDDREKRKYVISQSIPAAGMKGVSEDYTIFHVFGAAALGEAVYIPPPSIETLMEPTRAFLAEYGFYALDRTRLLP
jgi:hypothetical protein